MGEPSLRVLVADDEGIVRESICDMLDASGYVVCAGVASGEDAVEQASRLKPDVVLMDINMPGMGGIEAARLIRDLPQPVPVVFLTALGDREMAEQAAESGGFGYLVKPIHGHQIGPMLETAVKRFQDLAQAQAQHACPPETAARPVLDRLITRARSAGLDAAVEEFLEGVCKQRKVRGAAVVVREVGAPGPFLPACWGETPPSDSPVWATTGVLEGMPGVSVAPFLDAAGLPAGALILFGGPAGGGSRQDGELLKVYAVGLGEVLAAMRVQQPLAWRRWLQAGRKAAAS